MRVLQYIGKSWISKAIQFQTRSIYSHTAVELEDGRVIEAWQSGGVRLLDSFAVGHTKGTKIHVYDIVPEVDVKKAEKFLFSQLGKPYDFSSVLRFVSHRPARENGKWFCSELALTALSHGGVELLHVEPSMASPRDVAMSPYLRLHSERICYG